jgi:hypothetical protein
MQGLRPAVKHLNFVKLKLKILKKTQRLDCGSAAKPVGTGLAPPGRCVLAQQILCAAIL